VWMMMMRVRMQTLNGKAVWSDRVRNAHTNTKWCQRRNCGMLWVGRGRSGGHNNRLGTWRASNAAL